MLIGIVGKLFVRFMWFRFYHLSILLNNLSSIWIFTIPTFSNIEIVTDDQEIIPMPYIAWWELELNSVWWLFKDLLSLERSPLFLEFNLWICNYICLEIVSLITLFCCSEYDHRNMKMVCNLDAKKVSFVLLISCIYKIC